MGPLGRFLEQGMDAHGLTASAGDGIRGIFKGHAVLVAATPPICKHQHYAPHSAEVAQPSLHASSA